MEQQNLDSLGFSSVQYDYCCEVGLTCRDCTMYMELFNPPERSEGGLYSKGFQNFVSHGRDFLFVSESDQK